MPAFLPLLFLLAGLVATSNARCNTADERESPRWNLDIEILIQPLPDDRLKAQSWGRILQELGQSPRFRSPRAGDQTGLEDEEIRGTRIVHVVGAINPDGTLQIGADRFREGDLVLLREALDRISLYGAAGPPSENPTWGLTVAQYEKVVELMSAPVAGNVNLQSPVTAADSIGLPQNCRLRFTEAARSRSLALQPAEAANEADFGSISRGSALAIALAQFGLGFRPLADPAGGYILEIDAGGESDNLWPVGWKSTDPINRAIPEMFKSVDVTLEEVEFPALVDVISEQLKLPHFYSSAALADAGIDPQSLTYDRRPDRLSMARLMTILGDHFRLGLDVRVAENGSYFLWVTTREDYLAFRKRFAHVVPGKPLSR